MPIIYMAYIDCYITSVYRARTFCTIKNAISMPSLHLHICLRAFSRVKTQHIQAGSQEYMVEISLTNTEFQVVSPDYPQLSRNPFFLTYIHTPLDLAWTLDPELSGIGFYSYYEYLKVNP